MTILSNLLAGPKVQSSDSSQPSSGESSTDEIYITECSPDLVESLLVKLQELFEATFEGLFTAIKSVLTNIFLNIYSLLQYVVPLSTKLKLTDLDATLDSVSNSSSSSVLNAVLQLMGVENGSLILSVFPQIVNDTVINTDTIIKLLGMVSKGSPTVSLMLLLKSLAASLVRTYAPTCPK